MVGDIVGQEGKNVDCVLWSWAHQQSEGLVSAYSQNKFRLPFSKYSINSMADAQEKHEIGSTIEGFTAGRAH